MPVHDLSLAMPWTSLCELNELEEGQGKYVEIDGFKLAVFLDRGKPSVMDSSCPHAGANMAGGSVHDGCAVCPRHNWAFQLDTGKLRGTPAVAITVYKARVFKQAGGRAALVQADLPIY